MKPKPPAVPQELYPLLNHTINSMFGSDPRLRRFIDKRTSEIISEGLVRIGDIIQQSEERFFDRIHATPLSRSRLKEALREIGLEFGMQAPAWRPPASNHSPPSWR